MLLSFFRSTLNLFRYHYPRGFHQLCLPTDFWTLKSLIRTPSVGREYATIEVDRLSILKIVVWLRETTNMRSRFELRASHV